MKKVSVLMTALLFLCSLCRAQPTNVISTYNSFLSGEDRSAKDYILSLFDNHDIVVICERTHTEMTQYDLLESIISDERFIKNVGNVFVEIGTSKLNPGLNRFLHTRGLSEREVAERIIGFQRNASMWPIWAESNYFKFYSAIYELNNLLSDDDQISVYPSDVPFVWTETDAGNITDLKPMLAARDSIIASQIITTFSSIKRSTRPGKKALVIMNFRHAFNGAFPMPGGKTLHNVGWYLFNRYGDKVANVLLNTVVYAQDGKIGLVQNGKWDAAFSKTGKESVGFNFREAPFGKDSLDLWPLNNPFTYEDVFTGVAFYLPVEKHVLAEGIPGLIDPSFTKELLRRVHLISTVGGEFKVKMADFEKAITADPTFMNQEEDKSYYQIDSLLKIREKYH